jgi:hypothetical protein
MASQRPLERLLKQGQRLNQHDEYWAATSRLARMWITPKHAPPYRPYVTLLLSQQGKILRSRVLEHPPQPLRCLKSSCGRCAVRHGVLDRPAPHRIYLDNAEDVAALTPFWRLSISMRLPPPLSMADEVMVEMKPRWANTNRSLGWSRSPR